MKVPKTFLEFQEMFPDEGACWAHLRRVRWPHGFVCPRCGSHGSHRLRVRFAAATRSTWRSVSAERRTADHGCGAGASNPPGEHARVGFDGGRSPRERRDVAASAHQRSKRAAKDVAMARRGSMLSFVTLLTDPIQPTLRACVGWMGALRSRSGIRSEVTRAGIQNPRRQACGAPCRQTEGERA